MYAGNGLRTTVYGVRVYNRYGTLPLDAETRIEMKVHVLRFRAPPAIRHTAALSFTLYFRAAGHGRGSTCLTSPVRIRPHRPLLEAKQAKQAKKAKKLALYHYDDRRPGHPH